MMLEKKEMGALLRDYLTRLSSQHREIIDLFYYHEKSIAEVAAITGIPSNTVKTRMSNARRRLAAMLRAAGITQAWA
jgi:RNA polymerase sigma-70 factor (ECF subfamily)